MTGINASIRETISWTCKLTEQPTGGCIMCYYKNVTMCIGYPEILGMYSLYSNFETRHQA
jgi:hypothetical protein